VTFLFRRNGRRETGIIVERHALGHRSAGTVAAHSPFRGRLRQPPRNEPRRHPDTTGKGDILMTSPLALTAMVRAELPIGGARTLHAVGTALDLGAAHETSLTTALAAASRSALHLPGNGNTTTGALLIRDGAWHLQPLGLATRGWEELPFRSVRLDTLNSGASAARGSNLHPVNADIAALVHGDDVIRFT
jgi:hypothetical protein